MKALLLGAVLWCVGGQLAGCATGGCYAKQRNFTVSPSEGCLQPIFDVCDYSSIELQNTCSDALVVDTTAAPPGTSAQTIAPGARAELMANAFQEGNGHFRVPAKLGATPIVISWDVSSD